MESRASPNSTSTWSALLSPALPPLAHHPALSPSASLAHSFVRETPYNSSVCPFSNQRIDIHFRTHRHSPFEAAVLSAPSPRPFGFQIRTLLSSVAPATILPDNHLQPAALAFSLLHIPTSSLYRSHQSSGHHPLGRLTRPPSSVSVYRARALPRSRVDGCAPHTQHVNL